MLDCPSVSRLQLFKVFKYIVRTRITCTIKRKAHFGSDGPGATTQVKQGEGVPAPAEARDAVLSDSAAAASD